MKIYLVTANARPTKEQEGTLKKLGNYSYLNVNKLTPNQLVNKIPNIEILIAGPSGVTKLNQGFFAALPKLKLICLLTIGTNWVDLKSSREKCIIVTNIKGATAESVAEHVWAMVLNLSKRLSEFDRDARKGAYDWGKYEGREVYGKTIGIIGLGDIGKKVARIAKAFDMKVLGINKSNKPVKGVKLVTLTALLKESDIVSVNVPLNDETQGMITSKEIELMKDGGILVNCAREEVVDKKAVVTAVRKGKLFGYGVETALMKKVAKDDPYWTSPRILVNPHNGFNTIEAEIRTFDTVIGNIEAFLKGKPINVVN